MNVTFVITAFSQLMNLNTHAASVHDRRKPFKSDICDYICSQKGTMNTHEEKKLFKCDIW